VVALITNVLITDGVASHAAIWTSWSTYGSIFGTVVVSIVTDTEVSVILVLSVVELIVAFVATDIRRMIELIPLSTVTSATFESWLIRTLELHLASVIV